MIAWLWSVLVGHFHSWECLNSINGQYSDTKLPYVLNHMKCKKCGIVKPVIRDL